MSGRLVTTREAADQLGVPVHVIYGWARRRSGRRRITPAGRRGRESLWDVDQLLDAERDTRKRRKMLSRTR